MADSFQLQKLTVPANLQSNPSVAETVVGVIAVSTGAADAGKIILTNASGVLDPTFGGGGGSTTWASITSGTATGQTFLCGTGTTFNYSGTGLINANQVGGINVSGNTPTHAGMLLISQPGNTSAVWADPQVQGLYPAGAQISPAPAYVVPTDIQPIMVGGSDYSGTPLLQTWKVDSSGLGYVSVSNFPATQPVSGTVSVSGTVTVSGTVAVSSISGTVAVTGTFFQATQPVSGTVAVSSVSGSVAVTGTFYQATQPVSIASTVPVSIASTVGVTQSTSPWVTADEHITANLNQDGSGNVGVNIENTPAVTISSGTIAVSSVAGTVAVTGTFYQATQPVSGTVAATQSGVWNIGTVTSITNPVAATQSGVWTVDIAASQTIAVTNAGTFAVQAAVTGTVAVSSVSGNVAVTQSTSPWVVSNSGTFAVQASQSTTPWEVSPTAAANTASNPFFNEIVTGGSNVFGHVLNQDGSGNIGVNVENTVAVTGTFSGSTVTQVTPGTYVQSTGGSFTSSTTATQTLTGVVSGDTIFVAFSYTSTSTISSVVDNLGNKYFQVDTTGPENSLDFALYYTTAAFAGATTITVTFNTSTSGELVVSEYNGQVFLLTETAGTGTGTTFSTGAISPLAVSRSNLLGICFTYGQAGTLVTSNTTTTSSPGKALAPRFSNGTYILGDCILSEPNQLDFNFSQASSSGYAFIVAQFGIVNSAQVPLANATFYQKPGAWMVVGGVDTPGSSPLGGVLTVQGSGSGIALPVSQNVSTAWVITPQPLTSGGWSTNWQAALSDTATLVKASAGQLGGYSIYNPNATVEFVMWFNTSTPTVGTTTPIWVVGIPPTSMTNIEFVMGIPSSSIYVLATSSVTTATAPSSALQVTTAYK